MAHSVVSRVKVNGQYYREVSLKRFLHPDIIYTR